MAFAFDELRVGQTFSCRQNERCTARVMTTSNPFDVTGFWKNSFRISWSHLRTSFELLDPFLRDEKVRFLFVY